MNPNEKPKTAKQVTKYLLSQGIKTELVRGKGYWYFWGDVEANWYSSSVSVLRVSSLTFHEWQVAYNQLKEDFRN